MGKRFSKIAFWCQLGPFFLLAAAAAVLLKFHPLDAVLLALSFLGIFCIHKWERTGLFMASLALVASETVLLYSAKAGPASVILSSCIFCSWCLAFLGKKMGVALFSADEEQFSQQEEERKNLEKELLQAHALRKEGRAEIDQLKKQLSAALIEREGALKRIEQQQEAMALVLNREVDLQLKLASAQSHIAAAQIPLVKQEETEGEEKMCLEQLQFQHVLLREQFEEKSEILHRTRRDLFLVETELFALQKQRELEAGEPLESGEIEKMSRELCALEALVLDLQEVVSALIVEEKAVVKKVRKPRKSKAKDEEEQGLPFLLQQKIDMFN